MKKSVLSIALVASLAFVLLVGISSMVIRQAATANNSIAAPTPALSVAPTSPVVSDVPFVAQHFETHDVNRGYNDWQGYVGESCTDVAEQFISEELEIARPVRARFGADEDGGMHVLAPALYVLARSEGFPQNGETFQAFVIRMVDEQKLAPGKLESLKEDFQALQKLSNGFGFPLIEQEKT